MSQHHSPARPTLPAGTSDSSRDSSFNGRHPSDTSLPQSRAGASKRNASVACLNCKSAKRKCDQNRPCSNCRNTNKDCVYDASQDGRRKEVRKRRLDELEFRSNALDRLLLKLRNSTQIEARELIDLIKRDAPLEDIVDFIEKNPGELADETRRAMSTSPPPPEGAGIRRMLAISELIDMPPFQVEAAPWTAVTSDNAFVSHVLSAYYGWYHFHYVNFDWELFIAAFKAKDLDSPYCSPLLVNAVLGMGCMFTNHPSTLAVPGDPETRGQHFFAEAQRLYELEGDRLTLTNVQGFTVLIMLAAFSGKDRISSASLKKLEVMVPEFLSQYNSSNIEQPNSPELQKSLEIVEWVAYIYLSAFGISFMGPPTWSKPTLKRPYQSDEWKTHRTPWSPYPLNQEPIDLPQHTLYDDLCLAYNFMGDVQSLIFGEFPKLNALQKFEAAQELDRRNKAWYDSLPAAHRFDQPEFIVVPGTVDLALAIFFARLFLWNWTTPPASVTTTSQEGGARYQSDPTKSEKSDSEKVQEVRTVALATCSQIVDTIVSIGRRFDDQYGPTYHSMLMPQSGIFCANFLLSGNLHSAHEEGLLLEIMKILVQSSKRWQLVKGVTHMLLKGAEEKVKGQPNPLAERDDDEQPVIPAPGQLTREVFKSMELIVKDMAWSPSDYLHFSSRYPNYLVAKEDPTVELSNMLEQWAQLALDEMTSKETGGDEVEQTGYGGPNDDDIGPEAPPVHSIEHDDVPMMEGEELGATNITHEPAMISNEETPMGGGTEPVGTETASSGQHPVEEQQQQQSQIANDQQSSANEPAVLEENLPTARPEVETVATSESDAAFPAPAERESADVVVKASTGEAVAGEQATTRDHTTQ